MIQMITATTMTRKMIAPMLPSFFVLWPQLYSPGTGPGCLQPHGRLLGGIEIELDLRAHRVAEEHLPDAGLHLLAHRIRHGVAIERRERSPEVARREGDVIDHARAVLGHLVLRDVQDGLAAGVEPDAAEAERRPLPDREAEDVHVETPCRFDVVGEDVEVVHALDGHHASLTVMRQSVRGSSGSASGAACSSCALSQMITSPTS